jgi:hypothetical protein
MRWRIGVEQLTLRLYFARSATHVQDIDEIDRSHNSRSPPGRFVERL